MELSLTLSGKPESEPLEMAQLPSQCTLGKRMSPGEGVNWMVQAPSHLLPGPGMWPILSDPQLL